MKRYLLFAVQLILAFVFIFSGFVKSVDPMGTSIKFSEYLGAFQLPWLTGWSTFFSVLLNSAELALGFMLLVGAYRRVVSFLAMLFMSFFTILTLYIYIFSPVNDCGCFGDAIKLSNGATFAKNIVLLTLSVSYFIVHRHDRERKRISFLSLVYFVMLSVGINLYSLRYLPAIEFLPYGVGADINKNMAIPDDAPKSEYRTTLVYRDKSSGKTSEFEITDTTWYDTSRWEYVDTKSKVISEGFVPLINSFVVTSSTGDDHGDEILASRDTLFVITVHDLPEKADDISILKEQSRRLSHLVDTSSRRIIGLTQLPLDKVSAVISGIPFYNIDETQLKSMLRADRGVIAMQSGKVLGKWNLNSFDIPNDALQFNDALKSQTKRFSQFLSAVAILSALGILIFGFGRLKFKK